MYWLLGLWACPWVLLPFCGGGRNLPAVAFPPRVKRPRTVRWVLQSSVFPPSPLPSVRWGLQSGGGVLGLIGFPGPPVPSLPLLWFRAWRVELPSRFPPPRVPLWVRVTTPVRVPVVKVKNGLKAPPFYP